MIAMNQLLEVSIRLSAERNLDRLLHLIIEQTTNLLDADRSSLFLLNKDEGTLESKVAQGMHEEVIKVPQHSGIVGWVAEHKELLNISDVAKDKRHYKPKGGCDDAYPVHAMLSAPLLDADLQVHGVIQTMRLQAKPFSHEEEMLIRAMASLATVAICNALLNQQMEEANAELERKVERRTQALHQKNLELEKISITDALTGAYNRRYFDQMLVQEKSLADRYGEEFSLVMFDIDFFKKVNDNKGHDTGDAVLRQLSKLTSNLLRDCDYLFRYGGEEFVLLLPKTKHEGAFQLAERLRQVVEAYAFEYSAKKFINITISLGLATWCLEDKKSALQLLKRADQSLYAAKDKGRNQVC